MPILHDEYLTPSEQESLHVMKEEVNSSDEGKFFVID